MNATFKLKANGFCFGAKSLLVYVGTPIKVIISSSKINEISTSKINEISTTEEIYKEMYLYLLLHDDIVSSNAMIHCGNLLSGVIIVS